MRICLNFCVEIKTVAARTTAQAVIGPLYTGDAKGPEEDFKLAGHWIAEGG